jgi:hydroxypyruvate isomerase
MRRREFLASMSAPVVLAKSGLSFRNQQAAQPVPQTGRIKQGVTRGVFGGGQPEPTIEYCCREAARLGIKGFDFIDNPADWPLLKKYGLVLSMYRLEYGGGLSGPRGPEGPQGWNAIGTKDQSGEFQAAVHAAFDRAAANGIPNILLQTGTRASVSYEQGADNAVAFCNQVKAHAEDKGITLCMEIVNSKGQGAPPVNIGSMFDHMFWGVDVVKRVNSPRVKILYDIFHGQLMDGDIVQTIRDNIQYIGHFHTGGVPGRHELDETQELNYRFIAQAIADLNYTGFVTHEWSPAPGNDPIASLAKVIQIMNV